MEIKQERRRPLQNLSLKWSFILYVTACVLAALLASLLLSGIFSKLQNDIYKHYEVMYRDELARQGDIVVDGTVVQKDALWFYTESLHDKFSERDEMLYDLYGILTILVVPLVSVVSIIVTGLLFYRRKLKRPLSTLDAASVRIAEGDLDFNISVESRNEFGRLAASFETMRSSLHQTNREMWRMMEEHKRLNAAFAHDLRTPLTVLRGYCDYLLKYLPDGKLDMEKTVSTLTMMESYVRRLEGYTESMSSLQKLEAIVPEQENILFEKLCADLEATANELSNEYTCNFQNTGAGYLNVDIDIVFQVYENLISNAVRYVSEVLEVCVGFDENILSISVKDDGPGFSQEALQKAAEPYFRDEKEIDSPDFGHFGIGLYICSLLCQAHGGSLTLENDNGAKVTASFASLLSKNDEKRL